MLTKNPVITAILTAALDWFCEQATLALDPSLCNGDGLNDPDMNPDFQEVLAVFGSGIVAEIKKLQFAVSDTNVRHDFRPYHAWLFDVALSQYANIRNETPPRARTELYPIGEYRVTTIWADDILNVLDIDLDHQMRDLYAEMDKNTKEMVGLQQGLFGIANKMAPHPDELSLMINPHPLQDEGAFWYKPGRPFRAC